MYDIFRTFQKKNNMWQHCQQKSTFMKSSVKCMSISFSVFELKIVKMFQFIDGHLVFILFFFFGTKKSN